jgi:hypothetical protein
VVLKAAGMAGELARYRIGSLFSGGPLINGLVEKTANGLRPPRSGRHGPTGSPVSAGAGRLHPEKGIRALSWQVTDTPEQGRAVMRATLQPEPRTGDLT